MKKTPEQIQEALDEAKARHNKRVALKAWIKTAKDIYGIRFVEFPDNRVTFAYRYSKGRSSIVEISSALCHPNDRFDSLDGKACALNNMLDDQFIRLKVKKQYLKYTLEYMATSGLYNT